MSLTPRTADILINILEFDTIFLTPKSFFAIGKIQVGRRNRKRRHKLENESMVSERLGEERVERKGMLGSSVKGC